MAIAYFIPDQAKLLARTGGNNSQRPSQSTSTSAAADSNARSRPTTTTSHQQQQTQPRTTPQQETHYAYGNRNNHFRANISIPLASQQGSMTTGTQAENLGCWELLAQIFCYALRFYNYNSAQRRPTVIQISFEISSVGNDDNGDESAGSPTGSDSTDGKRH